MVDKIRQFCSSKWFHVFAGALMFICFIIMFIFSKARPDDSLGILVLSTCLTTFYGIIAFIVAVTCKNTFSFLELVLYFPFMFVETFNELKPIQALPFVIAVIGVIIHVILYKPKLKINIFVPCLVIYLIALSFGGVGSKTVEGIIEANYHWYYTVIMLVVGIISLVALLYITSDNEGTFIDLAYSLIFLGFSIILEVLFFILFYSVNNDLSYFSDKVLWLGWGNHNTVGIVLLSILPFPFYLIAKGKSKLYLNCLIIAALAFGIFISLSRGAIAVMAICIIPLGIYSCLFNQNWKKVLIYYGGIALAALVFGLLLLVVKPDSVKSVFNVLSKLNFNNMNGRTVVWKSAVEVWKSNPVFGIGLVGSANWVVDYPIQFAHNTLLEMLVISGTIGCILMVIHLVLKYALCLYKPNKEKICMVLSFLVPGIYGLVDVTYLSCYTMILVLSMFMITKYIDINQLKEKNIKGLFGQE